MHFKKALKLFIIFVIVFGWIFSGWPQLPEFGIKKAEYGILPKIQVVQATDCGFGTASGTQCVGIITQTASSTWNVPSDWNSLDNSIQAIGAGGDGGLADGSNESGAGGGGGEYRKAVNVSLTGGSTVDINVPSGGDGSSADGALVKDGTGGGASVVVEAKNGGNASGATAGAGGTGGTGAAANYDGGSGGTADTGDTKGAGAGGGGSAGPNGVGKDGGDGYIGTGRGGGGGGGSNGGSSTDGETPTSSTGGDGGNGTSGTGGGDGGGSNSEGSNGTAGGGGGGGGNATGTNDDPGGNGGVQDLWDTGVGPSGGGGGGGSASGTQGSGDKDGGVGGTYGGGGGGCGFSGSLNSGECDGTGVGGQGIIVITYTPSAANNPPSLTVSQPDGVGDTVTVGDSYNITYDLSDAEDEATVDFYYDSNDSGLDGTAITGCQDQAEGTGVTCAWNTTGMTPGDYYVYGIATDGVNPDVNDYSPGVITIQAVVVSVSVDDGMVAYGTIPANTTEGTCTSELNDSQTVTNDGNVTENFNIRGQNSVSWTLASTAGSDQYVHEFLNGSCSSFSGGTALTTSDQAFATGIASSETATLNLQINTPNPSTVFTQQSVDVIITAVQQ